MACHTKVGNTWREIDTIHTKVGSAWREVSQGWTKVGSTWRELDLVPPESTAFAFHNSFIESATFTAPAEGWYRVWVFGASGRGGYASTSGFGGGGGGSGGVSCSVFYMAKGQSCTLTITSDYSSFSFPGSVATNSFTARGNRGGDGQSAVGSSTFPKYFYGGGGGGASGGNTYNWAGGTGGTSGSRGGRGAGTQGANNGMEGGGRNGGGGGARYAGVNICPYVYTGSMGKAGSGGTDYGYHATTLPTLVTGTASIRMWGGGGGGGGASDPPSRTSPSIGHPGAVIIERGTN